MGENGLCRLECQVFFHTLESFFDAVVLGPQRGEFGFLSFHDDEKFINAVIDAIRGFFKSPESLAILLSRYFKISDRDADASKRCVNGRKSRIDSAKPPIYLIKPRVHMLPSIRKSSLDRVRELVEFLVEFFVEIFLCEGFWHS